MSNRNRHEGFTLIEMMLYLTLTTAILVVVCEASISLAEYRVGAYERAETLYTSTFAIDSIRELVHNGHRITTPAPGDSSPTLTLVASDGQEVTVHETQGQLVLTHAIHGDTPLTPPADTVDEVTFERMSDTDGSAVIVSFRLTSGINEHIALQLEETMSPRMSL